MTTAQLERPREVAPSSATGPPRAQRSRPVRDQVFAVAMGLVGLAIVDDAFLQPAPGTGAGDHLLSGGVPFAIAGLLVLLHPRIRRPGLRGWLWILCGALAVTAATTPLRHAFSQGPTGDDLTGLFALGAGLALVGGGVTTLWTNRRRGEPAPLCFARRAGLAVVVLLVGFFVVFPVGFATIATDRPRAVPAAVDLGARHERVTLATSDGLRLAAWYVPSRNGAAVIAFPGRSGPVPHARMLVRHGYGVLLLDRRGEGASEGEFNAFGWGGTPDLHAAVAFLRERPDVRDERIGGLGLSVGGELMLQAAAESSGLRAVVSEGAGVRSVHEHLHAPGVGRVQRWFSNWTVQHLALAVLSDAAAPPDLVDEMARIGDRPVLLIRGGRGHQDEALNERYAAAAANATLWTMPEAGHTAGLDADPEEYERRVVAFFDAALSP